MANTKKESTATTTALKETVAKTVKPTVDKEKEELKAKLAEQQEKMDELMAQISVLMKAQGVGTQEVAKSNKQIKFINLTSGGLNLRGVRTHHIDNQFGSIVVSEAEARAIVTNTPNAITTGCVYIPDNEFMESIEMGGLFSDMLNDEQLKNLLNQNANDVCEVFSNANDAQKKIIVDMITDRCLGGVEVDANILRKLGELSGVDFLDIEPLDDKE